MTCTVHNNREALAAHAAAFSVANRAYALHDANFNVTALVTRFTLIATGTLDETLFAAHHAQFSITTLISAAGTVVPRAAI